MLTFALFRSITVHIHPIFWVFASLIAWILATTFFQGIVWIGIIFFSVLVHELGHALVAKLFGYQSVIHFQMWGGLTQVINFGLKPWQEALFIAAGPLAGFLLALVCAQLMLLHSESQHGTITYYAVSSAAVANFFWTLFNLIPIQPLDGGSLLNVGMKALFGVRGIKITFFIGLVLAIALAVFSFSIHWFFSGMLFTLIAFENCRAWKHSLIETHHDHDEEIQDKFRQCMEMMNQGKSDDALILLQEVAQQTQRGVIYTKAHELMGFICWDKKEYAQVYEHLKPLEKTLSPEFLVILHSTAYRMKLFQDVIAMGAKVYRVAPIYQVAITNAAAHASRGETEAALGWIQSAKQHQDANFDINLQDPVFDAIRVNLPKAGVPEERFRHKER